MNYSRLVGREHQLNFNLRKRHCGGQQGR